MMIGKELKIVDSRRLKVSHYACDYHVIVSRIGCILDLIKANAMFEWSNKKEFIHNRVKIKRVLVSIPKVLIYKQVISLF